MGLINATGGGGEGGHPRALASGGVWSVNRARRRPNAFTMWGQRRRRWNDILPALDRVVYRVVSQPGMIEYEPRRRNPNTDPGSAKACIPAPLLDPPPPWEVVDPTVDSESLTL